MHRSVAFVSVDATMGAMQFLAIREQPLRIVLVWRTTIDSSWNYRLNSQHWRLYLNRQDGAWIDCAGERISLDAQRAWVVPPACDCRSGCGRPVEHFFVHFDAAGLPAAWLRRAFPRPFPAPLPPERLQRLGELRDRDASSAADRLALHALVADTLAGALAQRPTALRDELEAALGKADPVAPAIAFLDQTLDRPLDLAGLARRCGLSPDHFGRIFRQRTGLTPGRWLQERRVNLAAERLLAGAPIPEVAAAAGFANRHHFTRVFTRILGRPPARWRRSARS